MTNEDLVARLQKAYYKLKELGNSQKELKEKLDKILDEVIQIYPETYSNQRLQKGEAARKRAIENICRAKDLLNISKIFEEIDEACVNIDYSRLFLDGRRWGEPEDKEEV